VPRIKSAIKRVEVAERNRVHNRTWKSAVRTVRNKVADAAKQDVSAAHEALKEAFSVIDRAVSKGVLHRNSAARKKSVLATLAAKSGTAAPKPAKAAKVTKPAKATSKKSK
jgi:small subunit ribosomal protein S20